MSIRLHDNLGLPPSSTKGDQNQGCLSQWHGIDEVDLPGCDEHLQEMDATAPELGVNCRATTNQVWRENASGDITHFPFFAFQTQRKGSSRMWARVYKRLILRRPCTHPKTTLRSICKSKKKKLYLLWFKRNRNQTEFKLHSHTVPTGYVFTIVYSPSPTYPMKKEKRSRGIPQLLFL